MGRIGLDVSSINMQKTPILAAAVILILALGAGAYFYFSSGAPSVAVAPTGSAGLPVAGQTTSGGSDTTGGGTTPVISAPGTPVVVSPKLVQISVGPVVPGAVVVDTKAGTASSSPDVTVSYIERQSGNVFTYLARTQTLTRINNKTIPGIQSAAWLPDASVAFVRYLSGDTFTTINTYALAATSSQGFFLPQNLNGIAVASTSILTLASGVNGSIASLSRTDGTHPTTLFTTPLTSARIAFAGKNQYVLFSKPSSTLSGDAFLVTSAGRFSRIAGPLNGLVALPSPSGKWLLVSYTESSSMRLELVNTGTGAVLVLPISTIADKCVWSADESSAYCGVPMSPPVASYPDDWYQGAVQFSDKIWKINITGRYAQMVLDFSGANKGALDAMALAIDRANTTLVFMNKNDDSLWSYAL